MLFRLTAARRLGATALAGLLALYACLSVMHGAEHEHRYCAEHEAFEEVALPVDVPVSAAADSEAGDEAHRGCVLAGCAERHGSAVLRSAVALALLLHPPEPTSEPRTAFQPLSQLAVAPKSSPPARA